jgi:hypothetical protein
MTAFFKPPIMTNKKNWLILAALLTSLTFTPGLCAEDLHIVVVVGEKSTVNKLTADDVVQIFTGKIGVYPDGAPAMPINLPESSELRTEFTLKALKKTPAQLHAY